MNYLFHIDSLGPFKSKIPSNRNSQPRDDDKEFKSDVNTRQDNTYHHEVQFSFTSFDKNLKMVLWT